MPERLKGHDWKSCVPTKIGTEGSNPSLSATNHVGFVAALNLTWFRAPLVMHHAMNHVRFMIDHGLICIMFTS
jgi:hypothetical protein